MSFMPFMVNALGTPACDRNRRVSTLHKKRGQSVHHGGHGAHEGQPSMSFMPCTVGVLGMPACGQGRCARSLRKKLGQSVHHGDHGAHEGSLHDLHALHGDGSWHASMWSESWRQVADLSNDLS